MSLQDHLVFWCLAVFVAAVAPTAVRAYAAYLKRGAVERAERFCDEVDARLREGDSSPGGDATDEERVERTT